VRTVPRGIPRDPDYAQNPWHGEPAGGPCPADYHKIPPTHTLRGTLPRKLSPIPLHAQYFRVPLALYHGVDRNLPERHKASGVNGFGGLILPRKLSPVELPWYLRFPCHEVYHEVSHRHKTRGTGSAPEVSVGRRCPRAPRCTTKSRPHTCRGAPDPRNGPIPPPRHTAGAAAHPQVSRGSGFTLLSASLLLHHILQPLDRERRIRQRLHRDGHELQRIIICRDTV